jgi:hypothetical protein
MDGFVNDGDDDEDGEQHAEITIMHPLRYPEPLAIHVRENLQR